MSVPRFDLDQTDRFLRFVYPEQHEGHQFLIWLNGSGPLFDRFDDHPQAMEKAQEYADSLTGANVFASTYLLPTNWDPIRNGNRGGRRHVLREKPPHHVRGKLGEIAGINAIVLDMDTKEGHGVAPSKIDKNYPETFDEIRVTIQQLTLPPSVVVNTGHGYHCWYVLDQPEFFTPGDYGDLGSLWKVAGEALRYQVKQMGYDCDSTGDLTRVARLPGSLNVKDEAAPKAVTIDESLSNWERVGIGNIRQLAASHREGGAASDRSGSPSSESRRSDKPNDTWTDCLSPDGSNPTRQSWRLNRGLQTAKETQGEDPSAIPVIDARQCLPIPVGSRNRTLYSRGCSLQRRGFEWSRIAKSLTEMNVHTCTEPLPADEVECILRSVQTKPRGPMRVTRDLDPRRTGPGAITYGLWLIEMGDVKDAEVARRAGVSPSTVCKWRQQFEADLGDIRESLLDPLPGSYARVPHSVLEATAIGNPERRLLLWMARLADDHGQLQVSHRKLAESLGIRRATVSGQVGRLRGERLITQRYGSWQGDKARRAPSSYRVVGLS